MDSGSRRTQRDYTLALKLAVVEQVENGELTYKQAQAVSPQLVTGVSA